MHLDFGLVRSSGLQKGKLMKMGFEKVKSWEKHLGSKRGFLKEKQMRKETVRD